MSKSRLVLNLNTDLPIGTIRDILDDSTTRPRPFAQKVLNFLRGMAGGSRDARLSSGVVDSGSQDAVSASIVGTFTGSPTANDTISINGVIITFVASGSPTNNQVSLAGSPSTSDLALRLANAINNSTTDALAGVVNATNSGPNVTVFFLLPGYMGNSILLTDSAANFSWAGAATTLLNGSGCLPNMNVYYTPGVSPVLPPVGPGNVNLNSAAPFAILSKSGITDVPTSAITGNVGTSPITGAAITGLTSGQVTGTIFCVDGAGPAGSVVNPALLTAAVNDMQTAYTYAAGVPTPDYFNLAAGSIGGLVLGPGLYKWTTDVNIATSITLFGSASDTWIFQVAGNITQSSATTMVLAGGAQASNIVWQCGGGAGVTINTTAHFEGTILSATAVIMNTGASLHGRALAQTNVTLQSNTITLA